VDTYLVHHVNKSLGIISGEVFENLCLITVREDGLYQIETLDFGKSRIDQLFPGGRVPKHMNTVKLTDERSPEWMGLTSRGELARLRGLLGARKGFRPSTAASTSITAL